MKQQTLKKFVCRPLLLTIILFSCVTNTYGECYLTTGSDVTIGLNETKEFTWNADDVALSVSFDACKTMKTAIGNLNIYEYTNGEWKKIYSIEPGSLEKNSYKSFSTNLSRKAKGVKFENSGTYSRKITNIKVTQATYVEPSATTVNCGTVKVGGSSTDAKFTVAWSNVSPLTLALEGDAFSITKSTISSSTCNYGTEEIGVEFSPTKKGAYSATVVISESGTQKASVTLTGVAKGEEQQIAWWDESVTMLSMGEVIGSSSDPFAYATSGLALTELKSSDQNILKVENGTLTAVAEGDAEIIAYQAGDDQTEEIRDTLRLHVTHLKTQKISWEQKLSLKWGEGPITLNATSSAGVPITYEIVDNASGVISSLSAEGVLTISTSNAGTAIIRATASDGETEYATATMTKMLRVRDPNASCLDEPFVCDESNEQSFSTISSHEYMLDGSPAGQLSFDAKCEDIVLFWGGDLYVKQYINGSWSGKIATCKFGQKNTYYHFGSFDLDRRATKIQLFTETGATGKKVFKNIQVTRAHFVEADKESVSIDAQYKTTTSREIVVNYSNLQEELSVSLEGENDEFSVSPQTIGTGDCGEYGKAVITLKYTPSTIESDVNTLIIRNEKDGEIRIPISTTVSKRDQNLSWPLRDSVATTQTWRLNLENSASHLPITYTIEDETILKLDENGKLVYLQADTAVTITATCAGDGEFYNDATPLSIRIHIFKGLPELTLPTVGNDITYGQTLSEVELIGGKATTIAGDEIAGDFYWTNRNIVPNAGTGMKYQVEFGPYNQSLYDIAHDSLAINVNRRPQHIVWQMDETLGVMDSITLDARATSNLPVSYEIRECSGKPYANIGADNALNIATNVAALGTELVIAAWQEGDANNLPSDTVVYTVTLRKTQAEFFAATRPITVSAGETVALSDVEVHVESSVAGTWKFDDSTPTTLQACLWIAKGVFTPENQELCDIIEVEIPINIVEE